MTIVIDGLSTSRKTPGINLNIVLGGPGTSSGGASERLLLMGQKIESDLTATVGAQTYTYSAGAAALDTPELCTSKSDALAKYGPGELYAMAVAAIDRNPDVQLYCVAVGKAAGSTQATTTLALTGTAPTADLIVRVRIDGRAIEVNIPASTALATAAQMIAQAINDVTELPVYATVAVATITLTSKCYGERFTRITTRVDVVNGSTTYKLRTGSLTATVATAVFTLGAATLASAGAGTETTTLASALAALLPERWHRIAVPYDTAAPLTTIMAQVTTKFGPTIQLWEQVIAACVTDLSTATVGALALTSGQNNSLLQLAWHYNAERLPGVIAAQLACARLCGDGTRSGEADAPQVNLDGLNLNRIPVQESQSDYPTPTEVETALNYGVTPLVPSFDVPGFVMVARSITTKHRNSSGGLFYGVLDTTEVTVPVKVATELSSAIAVNFRGKNLDNDGPNSSTAPNVITPAGVRGFIYAELKTYEGLGYVVEVDDHLDELKVERATTPRSRLNMEVPVYVPAGAHQFGANIRQLGGF